MRPARDRGGEQESTGRNPRITFGIIVLNGEPFTRYNLRALYPFAHEIIVVEGASPKASHAARSDGHSLDGTLEVLRAFVQQEDPDGKVHVVIAENEGHENGFWPGDKDEQSQAYAKRATGDWLWQVDIDEFYHPPDMERVCEFLRCHPEARFLTFSACHFWGGFDYIVKGGLFLSPSFQGEPWGGYRRVFRWGSGYRYITHRPPTVHDSAGRDVTRYPSRRYRRSVVDGGPVLRHYFMVFADQVFRKGRYYDRMGWHYEEEVENRYRRLFATISHGDRFRVFTHRGTRNWLWRFRGEHPAEVARLIADVRSGLVQLASGPSADIDTLLGSRVYRFQARCFYVVETLRAVVPNVKRVLKRYLPASAIEMARAWR